MAENEIHLYGSVGYSWWEEDYFTAREVREKLAGMSGDITVRINSGGGLATEGQAIYTMLQDWPGKVTVIVDGVAASAASLIAMAGDEIVMRLGSWMLIHDPATPWTDGRGTEEDHQKMAALLGTISGAYADIYAARAGKTRDEARDVMRVETVLDGPMAVEEGFATSYDGTTQATAAATFDYRIYAHAPQELREASKSLGRAPGKAAVMAIFAGGSRMHKGGPVMSGKKDLAAGAADKDDDTKVDDAVVDPGTTDTTEPTAQAAIATERKRSERIMNMVALAGLDMAVAQDHIAKGTSADAVLDMVLAKRKETADVDNPMPGRATVAITRDERDTMRDGMSSAIVAQMSSAKTVDGNARRFMDHSLAEMAAAAGGYKGSLRTAGDRLRAFELAMSTHSTGDFPVIFENALNKRLLDSYLKAAPTYREVAMRQDFTDFRAHPIDRVGDWPNLLEIGEGGEIKYGTFGEKKESVLLRAYGRAMSITRQMLINDDMGAIDRVVASRGASVAAFEDATFWAMFLGGANGDGPTLTETARQVFNTNAADNTKAVAAAAITIPTLAAGRAAMRVKKSLDGQDLSLAPAILLVGPQKETEAEQLVSAIQPQQASNYNPFSGKLRVVVTPKIIDNAWYLLSDPGALPNFMYGFLQGEEGPRFRMDEPFGVQGVRFSVERDFGTGAIDFRGGWKNAGA